MNPLDIPMCNSFHIISYNCILFHIISFHFMSFHFISLHFISFHIIAFHFISFHFNLFVSFHFIQFLSHFISNRVIGFSRFTILCCSNLCVTKDSPHLYCSICGIATGRGSEQGGGFPRKLVGPMH